MSGRTSHLQNRDIVSLPQVTYSGPEFIHEKAAGDLFRKKTQNIKHGTRTLSAPMCSGNRVVRSFNKGIYNKGIY